MRFENLLTEGEEQEWSTSHTHLGVGGTGYADRKLLNFFRRDMSPTAIEVECKMQQRKPLFIWLKGRVIRGWKISTQLFKEE